MTAKDNLKILFTVVALLAIWMVFFLGLSTLFIHAIYNPWISSILMFLVFLITIWILKGRASWKQYGMIVVCIIAFAGCFFDGTGNPVYNLPIEWIYSDMGQFKISTQTTTFGADHYINHVYQIVDAEGTVIQNISGLSIIVFRFFEYVAIYSLFVTLFVPVISKIRKDTQEPEKIIGTEQEWGNWEEKQKQELHKRKQAETDSRQLNRTIEEELKTIINEGRTIDAIKLVCQNTSLNLKEAKELVESMNNSSHGK